LGIALEGLGEGLAGVRADLALPLGHEGLAQPGPQVGAGGGDGHRPAQGLGRAGGVAGGHPGQGQVLQRLGIGGPLDGDLLQHGGDLLRLQLDGIGVAPLGHALEVRLVGHAQRPDHAIDPRANTGAAAPRTSTSGRSRGSAGGPGRLVVGGGDQPAAGLGPRALQLGVGQQAPLGQVVDLGQLPPMHGEAGVVANAQRGPRGAAQHQGGDDGRQSRRGDPESDHDGVLAGIASGR
jgi:hypothetical protein